MERRNLTLIPWISLPFFLAKTAAAKEAPKDSALVSFEFLETFEGAGTKDFAPWDLADLPEDKKAPKKPPSGKSADGKEKNRRERKPEMKKHIGWGFFILILGLAGFAWGQPPGSSWEKLSPQEQQVLKPFQDRWNNLSPDRQERLRKGADRWQKMTPDDRKEAQDRFKRWQDLPPDQRDLIRKRYDEFRRLPAEEQEKIRNRSRWFRELPPEKRRELQERWQSLPEPERRELRPQWHKGIPEERRDYFKNGGKGRGKE